MDAYNTGRESDTEFYREASSFQYEEPEQYVLEGCLANGCFFKTCAWSLMIRDASLI